MKLGARIFKTGIAIVLALFVAQLLNLSTPVFAGIAAVFAVQPTIYRSYLSIIEQIQANVLGAVIAIIAVLLFGNHLVIIGLAAVILITLIIKLKIENTIGLATVTLIAIMESTPEHFIEFSIERFLTIMLGVLASFVVNLIFLPPKYETKLFHQINIVTEDILKWIRLSSRNASEHHLLKRDIGKIKDRLIKLDQLYILFKEDRNTFKISRTTKKRKLALYRQMISTTRRSFELLKRLHRFENDIHQFDIELQRRLQEQIDCLMVYHEQLLLKSLGKVKQEKEYDTVLEVDINRKELTDLIMKDIRENDVEMDDPESFRLLHLLSAILEYEEHLEHLDVLMHSFQKYHKDENKLAIDEDEA